LPDLQDSNCTAHGGIHLRERCRSESRACSSIEGGARSAAGKIKRRLLPNILAYARSLIKLAVELTAVVPTNRAVFDDTAKSNFCRSENSVAVRSEFAAAYVTA